MKSCVDSSGHFSVTWDLEGKSSHTAQEPQEYTVSSWLQKLWDWILRRQRVILTSVCSLSQKQVKKSCLVRLWCPLPTFRCSTSCHLQGSTLIFLPPRNCFLFWRPEESSPHLSTVSQPSSSSTLREGKKEGKAVVTSPVTCSASGT